MRIGFTAEGEPAPQGSMAYKGKNKKTGKAIITHSNRDKLVTWRESVVEAAREALTDAGNPEPMDGPLVLSARFFLRRGKTVKRPRPTGAPDTDKLVRAVGDALTIARVIHDDARIVEFEFTGKWYADGRAPGVDVYVRDLDAL